MERWAGMLTEGSVALLVGLGLLCLALLAAVLLKLGETARLAKRRRRLSDQLTHAYEQHRHQRPTDRPDR